MYEKGDGKIDVEHPYFWGVECVFDTKEGIKMRNDRSELYFTRN